MAGYSYSPISNILSFAVAFNPSSAFPLDARCMFGSLEAAETAAASAQPAGSSDSVYYYGQQIYVVEEDVITSYIIQTDKTLKPLGYELAGDNKTITLSDGVLSLKSFGVQYYAYSNGNYTLTTGWKDGLEPRVRSTGNGYEIAWYEPSTNTVDGLASSIASLGSDLDDLEDTVSSLSSTVDSNYDVLDAAISDAKTELQGNIDDVAGDLEVVDTRLTTAEGAITTLNGAASVTGSVKYEVAQAVATLMGGELDDNLDSLREIVDWIDDHAEDALEMQSDISDNASAIAAINALLGTSLPSGASATTVIGYITEAVNAEKTARETAVSNEVTARTEADNALDGRLDTIEALADTLGNIVTHNVSEFATAAQGAKADTAVQSVEESDTNGNISVDNNEVTVYTLPKANVSTLGGIKPDGSSISTDANGVASVAAVDHSKVTGLTTQLSNTQAAAESNANAYTDENAVAKTDVVTTDNLEDVTSGTEDSVVASLELLEEYLTWHTTM